MSTVREAVRIVVDRLHSHPHEFNAGERFSWVSRMITSDPGWLTHVLTEEERCAIMIAWQGSRYKDFHNKVMTSLLDAPQNENTNA